MTLNELGSAEGAGYLIHFAPSALKGLFSALFHGPLAQALTFRAFGALKGLIVGDGEGTPFAQNFLQQEPINQTAALAARMKSFSLLARVYNSTLRFVK